MMKGELELLRGTNIEMQQAISTCLSVFGGADGGVGVIKLALFLRDMDTKARAGDVAAVQMLNIVKQFGRLCDIATKEF